MFDTAGQTVVCGTGYDPQHQLRPMDGQSASTPPGAPPDRWPVHGSHAKRLRTVETVGDPCVYCRSCMVSNDHRNDKKILNRKVVYNRAQPLPTTISFRMTNLGKR